MKLNELKAAEGSRSSRSRIGRGMGSKGKTSGRGQKGQKARGKTRIGFEGGQMPLYRQTPKRGFTNFNRKVYSVVNLSDLDSFKDGADVDPEAMKKAGLIKGAKTNGVKILGDGKLTKKLNVKADKFSKSAEKAIKDAGGKAEVV